MLIMQAHLPFSYLCFLCDLFVSQDWLKMVRESGSGSGGSGSNVLSCHLGVDVSPSHHYYYYYHHHHHHHFYCH